MLRCDRAVDGEGGEDLGGVGDWTGECDEGGASREAEGRSERRRWGTGEAGQVDEGVGGGDCEEFERSAIAGAGLPQIRSGGGHDDGEEGVGGGLAGGEGKMGEGWVADAGGSDIRGGVGGRWGGGGPGREDDEGVGGGGSGEGRRMRAGLLFTKDVSGRVGPR